MNHSDNEAVIYNQTMILQKEDGAKLIKKLFSKYLRHVQLGDNDELKILDLGCGTGYLSNLLAESLGDNGKVIGVDPDGERIKLAKKLYGNNKKIDFVVANDQTFPEGEYDAVFCGEVIHWIKNKEAAFKRIHDNLKPSGYFAFTTQDDPDVFQAFPEVPEVFGAFGPQLFQDTWGLFYWESFDTYKQLAHSEGFEIASLNLKDRPLLFNSIDSLIDFLYGVFYGVFDRTSPKLDGVRKKYAGQTITHILPRLTAVFKKL